MAFSCVAFVAGCAQISGLSDFQVDDSMAESQGSDAAHANDDASSSEASPASDSSASAGDSEASDGATPEASGDASGSDSAPPPPTCTATGGPSLVRLPQLCIDSTEVTNDQYAAFLASNPQASLAPSPACSYKTSFVPSSAWPANASNKANPVVYVDWCDAYAFCAWAGKHLCGAVGGGPSSKANAANKNVDEWYIACSAQGASVYPYGGPSYIKGKCNDAEALTHGTRPVGSFTGCVGGYPGVFDMNGNVYEWEDACDVSAGASDACVIRGGSWYFSGASYGGCNTYFNDYTVKRSDAFNDTGFRCCDR